MTIQQPAFISRFFSTSDGLRLHARHYGSPDAPGIPVVCLPGLTRNSADFDPLASVLAAGGAGKPRRVLSLDYRGRGRSGLRSELAQLQPRGRECRHPVGL